MALADKSQALESQEILARSETITSGGISSVWAKRDRVTCELYTKW